MVAKATPAPSSWRLKRMRARIRSAAAVIVAAVPFVTASLGAQALVRGEIVCRDPDWPPFRYGLVTVRSAPMFNDLTSSTGGFVLHLPPPIADTLRDHHLD